jgi:hypothetical protein
LVEHEDLTHENSEDGAELANCVSGEKKECLLNAISDLKLIALSHGRIA